MSVVRILMLGGVLVAAGCATQQKAAPAPENGAVKKEAAQEINRICSLSEAEREPELKKLKEESGLVLFCGRSNASE